MRAVLTNFGSLGDLQPFLALAVEMRRHGHAPLLAFPPYFRPKVEALGLEFAPIGPDLQAIQNNVNVAMRNRPDSDDRVREILSPLMAALPQAYSELSQICSGADVLISGATQPAARMAHETSGIPFVSVQFSHFGVTGSPALQNSSAALINPFRAQLGLPPLRDPLTIDANSPQLALYAMSRYVGFPRVNWPSQCHITGYFFLDEEQGEPEPEIIDFITSGDPPIIINFGSMTHDDPAWLTELLLKAMKLAACRAIIQTGWSALGERRLTKDVLTVNYIPHHWLFSRAKCVVHHGGAGTAGAVFRAGVPSVFVPHISFFDQHDWAEFAHEMGCAYQPIPLSRLTAERLAAAVKTVIKKTEYRQNAIELAKRVQSEPGVRLARKLIEDLLQKNQLRQMDWDSRASEERFREREQRSAIRKQLQQNLRTGKLRRIDGNSS